MVVHVTAICIHWNTFSINENDRQQMLCAPWSLSHFPELIFSRTIKGEKSLPQKFKVHVGRLPKANHCFALRLEYGSRKSVKMYLFGLFFLLLLFCVHCSGNNTFCQSSKQLRCTIYCITCWYVNSWSTLWLFDKIFFTGKRYVARNQTFPRILKS